MMTASTSAIEDTAPFDSCYNMFAGRLEVMVSEASGQVTASSERAMEQFRNRLQGLVEEKKVNIPESVVKDANMKVKICLDAVERELDAALDAAAKVAHQMSAEEVD